MKISLKKVFNYFVAVMIILSHSMYTYTGDNTLNYFLKVLLSVMPLVYLVVCVRTTKLDKLTMKRLRSFLALYGFAVCSYGIVGVNSTTLSSYIFRFAIFVPLMTLSFTVSDKPERVWEAISNVVVVLSVISLFFWVFGSILHILSPTGQLYVTWNAGYRPTYFGLYSEVYAPILRSSINRNTSIFGEATVFCYFLCTSLLYECLIGKANKWKRIIIILALISTFSSSGFLIIGYVMIIDIYKYMKNNRTLLKVRWLFLPMITMGAGCVFAKLLFDKSKMASIYIRLGDYINGVKAWLLSPIVGHGYQLDTNVYDTGFSNSISLIIVNGGILLFSMYMLPLLVVGIMGIKDRRRCNMTFWVIGMAMLFSILIVAYTYHFLTVVAFCYAAIINRRGDVNGDNANICSHT